MAALEALLADPGALSASLESLLATLGPLLAALGPLLGRSWGDLGMPKANVKALFFIKKCDVLETNIKPMTNQQVCCS